MGWFRKINKNGEDYKPIGNVITATSLSVSGPVLADGDVVRVMFTTDIAGSDTSTPLALTWNGGATPIPVKASKEGSLASVYAHEVATNIFKYISGYVTLEMAFDGTNLVIVGNPVVLSGAGYTIYADGQNGIGPVGQIAPFYVQTAPIGWLSCDGATFDQTKYPALYTVLGSNTLPDLRECALVGIGQSSNEYNSSTNPNGIQAHDVYTLGEFKDDQFQGHKHSISGSKVTKKGGNDVLDTSTYYTISNATVGNPTTDGTNGTPRIGTTTHGKQIGVLYCIKAV